MTTSDRPYYNVLAPRFYPTGRFFTDIDRRTGRLEKREFYGVMWDVIGEAHDMEDAKRQFGGHPVLERAEELLGFGRKAKLLHQARREEARKHDHGHA